MRVQINVYYFEFVMCHINITIIVLKALYPIEFGFGDINGKDFIKYLKLYFIIKLHVHIWFEC